MTAMCHVCAMSYMFLMPFSYKRVQTGSNCNAKKLIATLKKTKPRFSVIIIFFYYYYHHHFTFIVNTIIIVTTTTIIIAMMTVTTKVNLTTTPYLNGRDFNAMDLSLCFCCLLCQQLGLFVQNLHLLCQ